MKESTSKEKILKKVRHALIYKDLDSFKDVDLDTPVHLTGEESPELRFAQNFTEVTGRFAFCESPEELSDMLWGVMREKGISEVFCLEDKVRNLLQKVSIPFSDTSADLHTHHLTITECEFLIARTGSIMLSSGQKSGRRLHAWPDIHIVLAWTSQIVPDIADALQGMKAKYGTRMPSLISTVSGPSRTADIEKTLVLGAHGPKELYLFLMDQIF